MDKIAIEVYKEIDKRVPNKMYLKVDNITIYFVEYRVKENNVILRLKGLEVGKIHFNNKEELDEFILKLKKGMR